MENNRTRTLLGAGVGNFFEWLDFTIFGFFSTAIALTFFPGEDEILALVATIGVFAIGFITRPLGAYVMGRYADSIGRTNALVITFALMGLGTVLIVAGTSACSQFPPISLWQAVGCWPSVFINFSALKPPKPTVGDTPLLSACSSFL